uniref:Uncharacterized protein n=1 Tax=Rhipicephalus pulchellus TaxID=72859 RepID=L7M381_RHIPC
MASILHHETNSPGCYCCPIARQPASASTPSDALDASLHELGMLSAVTDSRQDYLLEKLSRSGDSGPHHSGLCVLAMNSAYFSFVAASERASSETVLTLRRPRIRGALRRRFYQPYDYPWRQRLVEMLRTREAPPCDGANKSNPGSPSKLAGGGIVRSKSLDDLEGACGTKADIIETVSRKISNLHFS